MELLRPLSDSDYPAKTISAVTGSSTSTSVWQPGAQGVVVWATTNCYVTVNTDSTSAGDASSSSTPIPANVPIPFYVVQQTSSRPFKVSAQAISSNGTVYCKPINIR